MKRLAEFFEAIRELYEDGVEMICESWKQIAHITCMLGIITVLWTNPEKFHAVCWSIIFAVYLIMLAIVGYCRFWDVGENENNRDKLESLYTKIYVACCIALTVAGGLICGIIQTVVVVGIFTAISILFYRAGDVLICTFIHFDGKKGFFEKIRDLNPNLYANVYLYLLLLMLLIPLVILEVNPILKVIFVMVYVLAMPIVALLADNGIDIEAIFD